MNLQADVRYLLESHPELDFVQRLFEQMPNAEIYLVGGAVRDLLRKQSLHAVDFDFVIRGMNANTLEQWFTTLGEINFVGRIFGVYKFIPEGFDPTRHPAIDIALPRTETPVAASKGGYKDFTVRADASIPIEQDLARRDFTINAMAINLKTAELIDPFGGQHDLFACIIKTVGEPRVRFEEDLSRMLRAIRFVASLEFSLDLHTQETIRTLIPRLNDQRDQGEYIVPRETVGMEVAKALYAHPSRALEQLNACHALTVIFGSQTILPSMKRCETIVKKNLTLTVGLLLATSDRASLPTILSQSGLDTLPRGSHLRIEPEDVYWLVDRLQEDWNETSIQQLRASKFEKFFMSGRGRMLITALECIENTPAATRAKKRTQEIRARWDVEQDEPIPALLSGNDILESGYDAGPQIRQILEELRDQQLDGHLLTREQAKRWLETKKVTWGTSEKESYKIRQSKQISTNKKTRGTDETGRYLGSGRDLDHPKKH